LGTTRSPLGVIWSNAQTNSLKILWCPEDDDRGVVEKLDPFSPPFLFDPRQIPSFSLRLLVLLTELFYGQAIFVYQCTERPSSNDSASTNDV
jgi:hypothetical protein